MTSKEKALPEGFAVVYKGLKCCGTGGTFDCNICPYFDRARQSTSVCRTILHEDALRLFENHLTDSGLNDTGGAKAEKADTEKAAPTPEEREKERLRERRAAYMHLYYTERTKRLRAAGLCVACTMRKAKEGYVRCEACMQKRAKEKRARNREKVKEQWREGR